MYISCYKFEMNRAKGCWKWSDFYSKCVKTTQFLTAALLFNHQHTHVRELSKKETCFYSNEFWHTVKRKEQKSEPQKALKWEKKSKTTTLRANVTHIENTLNQNHVIVSKKQAKQSVWNNIVEIVKIWACFMCYQYEE